MKQRPRLAYRRGQRPDWADQKPGNTDTAGVEEQKERQRQIGIPTSNGKSTGRRKAPAMIEVQLGGAVVETPRKHTQEAVHTKVVDTEALAMPQPEHLVEEDADEALEKRRRWREQVLAQEMREQEELEAMEQTKMQQQQQQQRDDDDEEEEESEESSYESEEEDDGENNVQFRRLLRPIFVRRDDRDMAEAAVADVAEEDEQAKQRRVRDSKAALVEALKRGEIKEDVAAEATFELGDDTDYPQQHEEEMEAWKRREMARIRREKERRAEADRQRKELARRRKMTDEEVIVEDAEKLERKKKEKKKVAFLAKYYHKGAFFTGETDSHLVQRDTTVATGMDAEVDRSLLPKVLQVKNFGLAGRSKYTHLADQDTTRGQDNPWKNTDAKPTGRFSKRRSSR